MARTRSQENLPEAVKNAPPLDLAALAASVVVTKPRTGGGRFANNPYIKLIRDSYELVKAGRNGWIGNTVQGYHVRDFNGALRHAGNALTDENIGVRIRFEYTNNEGEVTETGAVRDVPEDDRAVLVKFTGTRRRIYLDEEQTRDAIAQGYILKKANGDPLLDKDGNPKADGAAYLAATQPPAENGNGEDEYDEDEDEYDEDDEDEDEDDENADASDYVSA
jgi:hypothetical protein